MTKAMVKVAMWNGVEERPGVVLPGPFTAWKNPFYKGLWTVNHAPTGRCFVGPFRTARQCEQFVVLLLQRTSEDVWKVRDLRKLRKFRRVCRDCESVIRDSQRPKRAK
jgi:hypothetical protein